MPTLKQRYHEFFSWLPEGHVRLEAPKAGLTLVRVDRGLVAMAPVPAPTVGWYVVHTDDDRITSVEVFGEDEQAAVLTVLAGAR